LITLHDGYSTIGQVRTFENSTTRYGNDDNHHPPEHESTEADVFLDLEKRYSAKPVSQADFFAPAELCVGRDEALRRTFCAVDEDVPTDPTIPQIFVHGPDENDETSIPQEKSLVKEAESQEEPLSKEADPEEKPLLRKAVPLERKTHFSDESSIEGGLRSQVRARRHSFSVAPERQPIENPLPAHLPSISIHITRPLAPIDTHPKGGWRMRSRCLPSLGTGPQVDIVMVYLYNSAMVTKSGDPDADMNNFRHVIISESAPPSPKVSIQRARTDLGKQPRQVFPNLFTTARDRAETKKPEHRVVNWLQDADMLRKQLPGSRIITVGFDILPTLSTAPDFETAAHQLNAHLQALRKPEQAPIVFLGHTLGGMIVLQALTLASMKSNSAENILSHVAGVFLFSCSIAIPEQRAQLLANLYGAKPSDKIFADLTGVPAMDQLSKIAKSSLFSSQPRNQDTRPIGPPCKQRSKLDTKRVAIGFPITQFFARSENQGPAGGSLSGFLGTPVRTVTMARDLAHAMKFHGSHDTDFLRIILLVHSTLQASRILRAAVMGNVNEMGALLREGVNPNLRDRW
jgi:hypothetical protein